jgi:hypothetical protein
VLDLVETVPIVAGLPTEARATNANNTSFTQTKMPTPVSDEGEVVDGSFEMTLHDRALGPADHVRDPDRHARPEVQAAATFEDPEGNEHELEVDHLRQWVLQENGGGVITDGFIHGNTGIGSPLFPRILTYGAFGGVGTVSVNGEVVNEDQWIHFTTTQTVRNADCELATQDALPLELDETIAGQPHHTNVVLRPIEETPDGPAFSPVETEFNLKPDKTQPFIHAMFEHDRVRSGPFADQASDPWIDEARRRPAR